ncbi:Ectoine hydroxylase-related dioxygenase, phytanoyl-CoA dioxygenase (PhyH) family [Chitinophaga sp. YR627]|uniref:phytanoyl-CoA dioxygenase family protein n=1 Tax=Chitinophaga sp. YR627 TaxID=1881041 RepID=UPI0008EEC751|nr:phytanoyl-CoA dioxygenase family protein [Chitinophaga sp. YR627]SFO71685.1 Ectoine hydroxylase-related dioxygenase, phytanoyl-CoA dioxygenase (PhyH) family [Chitinophaga sp. YR627]
MSVAYQTFTLGNVLTGEQQSFFEENGYIHFSNFLTPEQVQEIVSASEDVQQRWISGNVEKVNGVPVKYGKDLDGQPIVQRFAFINQHTRVLSDLLKDNRLQALLQLIGPGARLGENEKDGMVLNHYVNGPESTFTKMGWHTDGLRDIFLHGKLNPMLNVGIHLSNLRPENGGLRIIPGTHKQNIFSMLFRKKYFVGHKADKNELAITPNAGDLTVHDGRLWHRVAQSNVVGEASRRRVIYVPIIAGKYEPKHENSPTLLYQRLAGVILK